MKQQLIQAIAELEKLKIIMPFADDEIDQAISQLEEIQDKYYWEMNNI